MSSMHCVRFIIPILIWLINMSISIISDYKGKKYNHFSISCISFQYTLYLTVSNFHQTWLFLCREVCMSLVILLLTGLVGWMGNGDEWGLLFYPFILGQINGDKCGWIISSDEPFIPIHPTKDAWVKKIIPIPHSSNKPCNDEDNLGLPWKLSKKLQETPAFPPSGKIGESQGEIYFSGKWGKVREFVLFFKN